MYELVTPSQKRFRTALGFSLFMTPAVIVASMLMSHTAPKHWGGIYVMLGGFMAVANLLSIWLLVAALAERRPVWTDRAARWAWFWALGSYAALGYLGVTRAGSNTLGAFLAYAAGLCAIGFGGVGLLIAALPRWGRSDP